MYNSFFTDYKKTGKPREATMHLKEAAQRYKIGYSTFRRKFTAAGKPVEIQFMVKQVKYYSIAKMDKWWYDSKKEHL